MSARIAGNWFFVLVGLPFVVLLIVVFGTGSRLLINPKAVEISPCGTVVVQRSYPLADWLGATQPWIKYTHTVVPMSQETNGGMTCREDNGNGQRYTHDGDRGFGKWSIEKWAADCLVDPLGFKYSASWQGYLFDMIPLRPVEVETALVKAGNGWSLCPTMESPEAKMMEGRR